MTKHKLLVGILVLGTAFASGCAQNSDTGSQGSGGAGGNTSASGGAIGSGGTSAAGGKSGTGGTVASGGTTGNGGATASGGGSGAGGTSASGGNSSGGKGGSGSGGTTTSGGSGGSSDSGGSSGRGGAGAGGTSAKGGAGGSGSGGASETGGSGVGGSATGGSGTGGRSGTGGASGTGGGSGASGLPALTVNGTKLQDPSGKTIVLRGTSLIDIGALYAYGGTSAAGITARMDKIATAGVQGHVVRLPVYPKVDYNLGSSYCSPLPYPVGGTGSGANCTPATTGTLNAADYYTKVLKPAVDYATSKNLYVIIDHHQIDDATKGTSAADAKTFWADIAPKFASYNNVLYEPFNEPIDGSVTWATLKPVVQTLVDTIRSGGAPNVIIVPSNSYCQRPGDAASDPPTDAKANLMYTAHVYPGNWNATFKTQVATAATKAPVFVTEWGYDQNPSDTVGGTTSATWGTDFEALVDGNGASWTAWVTDNGWTPNIFSDSALTALTPFGTVVKNWLAAKAASDWVQ